MRLRREAVLDHLRRISCRGKIKEVIFTEGLAAAALTPDHLLLVVAPALLGAEDLKETIGVAAVDLLIKAITMVPGSEDDVGIDITFEDHRLVLNESERGGRIRLLTAAPRTIATRVEPAIVDQLLQRIGSTVMPLLPGLLTSVCDAFSGLKAEEVEVLVGPEGGMIRVGDAASNLAEFPVEELRAETEYALNFGAHLIDVLATVGPEAILYLGAAGQQIAIQDGEYTYLLSPRAVGSDRKLSRKAGEKKKVEGKSKGKGKAEAVEAAAEA
jgi:hypothetical protein